MIKVKMYPAKNGDSFLIKHMDKDGSPTAILIDGGYASTFRDYIQQDLIELNKQDIALDLVVATHIDADHICGLLELFEINGHSQSPAIIPIKHVFHNSLKSISDSRPLVKEIPDAELKLLSSLCRKGFPVHDRASSDPIEISARQGSSLAVLLLEGEYCWNFGDGTTPVYSKLGALQLKDNLKVNVLGPDTKRLKKLKHLWMSEVRRTGYASQVGNSALFYDAFEYLCARNNNELRKNVTATMLSSSAVNNRGLENVYSPDISVTNCSSISLVIEIGTSRLLFLGDSGAEDIETMIEKEYSASKPVIFDAIKISHHGSLGNTSPNLLKLIDSPYFFISSDGNRHKHPDLEVLQAIVDRPSGFERHLFFNYSTLASKQLKGYSSTSGVSFQVHEEATNWISI